MLLKRVIVSLSLLLAHLVMPLHAQENSAVDLNTAIPVDEQLTTGQLSNGLTYYIRHNQRPEQKAELRLVIRAGSLNEQEDQRGLAHLLEHMAFNGTKHFPKQTLVDQLQHMGVQFGADLNAYTGFNETVYILPIPLNDPSNLKTGLQILEDWAFHMNLEPNAIHQERPVVEEEWRLHTQNPESKITDQNIEILLKGSLYPKRQPIGDISIVRNAPAQRLRDFYHDWYRPNLMSVIVVGDVDVSKTKVLIEQHFGHARNPENPPAMPSTSVANNTQALIGIFSHKDLSKNSISLTFKERADNPIDRTIQDYIKNLKHQLISLIINERLSALQDSAKPPFIKAYSAYDALAGIARSKKAYTIDAQVSAGKEINSLQRLHQENRRVIEHGFTQDELDRAIRKILASVENIYNNRDKVESADKADEYVRGVIEHEPLPSLDWEYSINKQYLPRITLDEINHLARSYFNTNNRIALINTSQTNSHLNHQTVLKIINSTTSTTQPNTQVIGKYLLKTQPIAGKIINSTDDSKLGLTTWLLSNGAVVHFKKTDFNDDEIRFSSYSDGGFSQLSDDLWLKTQWVYSGLDEAGVNGYNNTQLSQLLAGKLVKVHQEMNQDSQDLSGVFAPKDAETAFQLIYSKITATNHDLASFERYKQRTISETQNLERDRVSDFMDQLSRKINHQNPRFTSTYPNAHAWQKMDYDAAYQAFQQSHQNANGMQFIFVGKTDEAKLKPLVETYIASLPSRLDEKNHYQDRGYREDINSQQFELKKGKENLSVVYIAKNGEAPYHAKEALAMHALGEILTIKLTETLRENEGGVYSINAYGEMHARPFGEYNFVVTFPCAPDKADTLIKHAQAELDQLIQKGPDPADLDKFKKSALVSLHEELKTNSFWVNSLQQALKRGTPIQDILASEQRIQDLSIADIQNIGQKYLLAPRGVAILRPE